MRTGPWPGACMDLRFGLLEVGRGKWKAQGNTAAPFVDVHAWFTGLGSEPQVKQRVFELLSQHANSFYNPFQGMMNSIKVRNLPALRELGCDWVLCSSDL